MQSSGQVRQVERGRGVADTAKVIVNLVLKIWSTTSPVRSREIVVWVLPLVRVKLSAQSGVRTATHLVYVNSRILQRIGEIAEIVGGRGVPLRYPGP